MAQWLLMQGDTQSSVSGLAELETRARRGDLRSGDMIQPPGTDEWMYVTEVPELKEILDRGYDDDDEPRSRSMLGGAVAMAIAGALGVALLGVIVVGGGFALYLGSQMSTDQPGLIGKGGLTYSEMIVTNAGAGLRDEADPRGRITTDVPKDSVLELLAKRGDFYRARTRGGAEGWIGTDQVIPMYQLGGADVREEYDPLYNPDQYVEVANARWMLLPADKNGQAVTNVTAFEFMMTNNSRYPMTDLKIVATIKDTQGHEVERIEIPVEGLIPPNDGTFVGMLSAEDLGKRKRGEKPTEPDRVMTTWSFEQLAKDDPDLQLRWTSGVEVEMKTEDFANADIHIVELRAVPDDAAATIVRR
ncbi:MAG: SH3 domain-containing protein [Myxococcota bacterium]